MEQVAGANRAEEEETAAAVAQAETREPEPQQQPQEQEEQVTEEAGAGEEQPSGYVAETQTQTSSQEASQAQRADELTDREEEEEGDEPLHPLTQELPRVEEEEEKEQKEEEPAPQPTREQERPLDAEEKQEEQAPPRRSPEDHQQEQEREEKSAAVDEEPPPRFEPPSPPREQPKPASMSAPPRSSRYSYTELKEAQRRCEGKMVETALLECRDASRAQQEIFRAHVTDLCANIFAAAMRKYNPENKEDLEPVDPAIAAKVAEMEKKLKAKEAAVHDLRKQVPHMAAMSTRLHLASERKRNADVLVTAPEVTDEVEMTDVDVDAMRDAFVKTSTTIANANAKLSQVISQTTETIHVVEQAMKRPKTSIDKAMEHSPLKTTVLLTDQEMASDEHPSSMRTRLAMHLSTSRSF